MWWRRKRVWGGAERLWSAESWRVRVWARLPLCLVLWCVVLLTGGRSSAAASPDRPNILFVFADQWRADAMGYTGDPNVKTPQLDRLARASVSFTKAVSGCPVCCPYRATLMTGRRPLSHGVFLNDVQLSDKEVTMAELLLPHGYQTAYIGKWHLDGHGRSAYIPPERRQGFTFFKALECTHDYGRSFYYEDDDPTRHVWDGYDAFAQTEEAVQYMRDARAVGQPFLLMLSWGPPHNPYETAPEKFRAMYRSDTIQLRPNVPPSQAEQARAELAGYYAHCSALDQCVGDLWQALRELKIEDNTIFVFTSDHGDMLHSQGQMRKQRPWDESVRVPLLIHYPHLFGRSGQCLDALVNSEDLLPTLLALAGVPVPATVEGLDYSQYMQGAADPSDGAALLTCPAPFGEWTRNGGGHEYRAIRTSRYTYAQTLDGPWLLFDNVADPYQQENLVDRAECVQLQADLQARLQHKLDATADRFLSGSRYIEQWGYTVDGSGTVPYEQ